MKTKFLILCTLFAYAQSVMAQSSVHFVNQTELIADKDNFLPIADLGDAKIALISTSQIKYAAFRGQISRYAAVSSYDLSNYRKGISNANVLIIIGERAELKADFWERMRNAASKGKKVIFCELGDSRFGFSAGLTSNMIYLKNQNTNSIAQRDLAMSVFGGIAITQGSNKRSQTRLQYADGQEQPIGLDISKMTRKIDAVADEAIKEHATPGLVVMVVKSGRVLLEKSYGFHTYDNKEITEKDDIFDLASVSKISATTPLIMHLYEQHKIQLDSTLGFYLPAAKNTNKAKTTLRTVLLHEGGFEPYIPFYRALKTGDISRTRSSTHQVQLADQAFLKNGYYENIMWPGMLASPIRNAGQYVYSDISMYAMKEVAETVTGKPIDAYLEDWLYKRIGMQTIGYNPRKRFPKNRIVPTENDTAFRKEVIQGFVHDQGAAMANGVAGHAGLFASANDLAIYGQMLLNRGTYGGVRYFNPTTVDLFTSRQSKSSRRGLGFDRYDLDASKAYPSRFANESVYGHTGFTGTCLWIDPKHQLVYIFLSNRVYPDVSNKLYDLNIRSRIQDAIYETLNDAK